MQDDASGRDDTKFYALVGRALNDPEFRARLKDPDQQADALTEVGITPTDAVLQALNEAVEALENLESAAVLGTVPAVA